MSSPSGLRSPTFSLGGLTAVDEIPRGGGSPTDALKALEGVTNAPDRSWSPAPFGLSSAVAAGLRGSSMSPRLRVSTSTDASDSPNSSTGTEEVFEAVAAPRPPRSLLGTPQERAQRLVEERKRRERRDVGGQMIKELEAVIGSGGGPGGSDGKNVAPAANVIGRRRPYSMYNIGQRVTTL